MIYDSAILGNKTPWKSRRHQQTVQSGMGPGPCKFWSVAMSKEHILRPLWAGGLSPRPMIVDFQLHSATILPCSCTNCPKHFSGDVHMQATSRHQHSLNIVSTINIVQQDKLWVFSTPLISTKFIRWREIAFKIVGFQDNSCTSSQPPPKGFIFAFKVRTLSQLEPTGVKTFKVVDWDRHQIWMKTKSLKATSYSWRNSGSVLQSIMTMFFVIW